VFYLHGWIRVCNCCLVVLFVKTIVKKLLFIDDSSTARHLLQNFVKDICAVECAVSAEDGIEKIHATTYDLLLVDFALPGANGLELIAHARKMPTYKTTPIIVTSSSLDLNLQCDAMEYGANDYIAKPLKKEAIRDMLLRMFDAPYTRVLDKKIEKFVCVTWETGGRFFEYCPGLGFLTAGETQTDTRVAMGGILQEVLSQAGDRARQPLSSSVRLHTHTFES